MRLEDKPGNSVYYLFELGKTQIEIRCIKSLPSVPLQEVTIACNNSERLKKRLDSQGIKTTEYKADPYTGLRAFSFGAPDGVKITMIEE